MDRPILEPKIEDSFTYDRRDLAVSLLNSGIRLNYTIEDLLGDEMKEAHESLRYGSRFALASGQILRRLCDPKKDKATLRDEIFRINTEEIYTDILAVSSNKRIELKQHSTPQSKYDLVDLLEDNPDLSAQLARRIEELPEEYEIKLKMLITKYKKFSLSWWFLYMLLECMGVDVLDSSEKIPEVAGYSGRTRFANCKDAEYYFDRNIKESFRADYGARSAVIVDETGEPIIFQKIGLDAITHTPDESFSNSTGITLVPLKVNGIIIPAGTLVGISPKNPEYILSSQDAVVSSSELNGIYPLRISIFACSDSTEASLMFEEQFLEYCTSAKSKSPTDLKTLLNFAYKIIEKI